MERFGKVAYNSTAAYGRFRATTGLMLAAVISGLLMVWGVYNLYKKMTTSIALAKITEPNCLLNEVDKNKNSNTIPSITYTCNLDIAYTLDRNYNSTLAYYGNNKYSKGQPIKIAYSKNDIRDIEWPVSIWIIIIPILASIILFGLSYSNYYMTKTSKDYAALKGSFNIMNNISGLTKKKKNLKNKN